MELYFSDESTIYNFLTWCFTEFQISDLNIGNWNTWADRNRSIWLTIKFQFYDNKKLKMKVFSIAKFCTELKLPLPLESLIILL